MSDGALRISILGDASQFTKTLDQLEKDLKGFQDKLKSATGVEIPKLNLQILGAETSIKQITEFGKFAQGSLGFYQQLKKELEGQLLVTTNRAEQEDLNKRLVNTLSIIKEIKSAGIEKPIPIPIVIEPPPPGSISDIRNQISEVLKEKQIAIGVNLTNANVKLQGLRNELSVLEKQGIEIEAKPITPVLENSIQGIKNKIEELNAKKVLIDIDDKVGLATINKEIGDLTGQLTKANSVSFDKNGKIVANADKASQALTSLSLVAQDAAFGFIAIQNNLPAVFQTFSDLRSQSEGVKGVLQTLGASLVGPAGLFLAFSVVTGAVTYAIKEYGSLSNAVKALTGANSDAIKSQFEFNKALGEASGSIGGDIAKIQILVKTYQDENSTQEERLASYRALKEINPKIVAGIDDQNYATAASIELVGRNAKEIINLIKVQTKQKAISKVLDELTEKRFAANGKFNAAKKKADDFNAKIAAIEMKEMKDRTTAEKNAYAARNILSDGYAKDLNDARAEIKGIATEEDKWYNSLKPITTEISNSNSNLETLIENRKKLIEDQKDAATFALKIDTQDLDEAYNLDKIKSNVEKYGNALIDVNNTEKERKNALKELLEINPEYFKSFDLNKKRIDELRGSLESYIRTLLAEKKEREDLLRISKLNEDFRKNEEKGIKSLGDKYNTFADQKTSFPETFEDIQKAFEGDTKKGESLFKNLISDKADVKRATEPLAELQRQFQLAYTAINQTFFEPLQNLFETFLNTGKFTFKEFTKSVLKSITSIVSKLAATGVITGLMYLLDPSGMLASFGGSFGGGGGGGNGILSALGSIFGAQPRKPDFNGVRPSGGGRGGEKVEFQIRGTNLVGVLNRANGEINRIG